MVSIEDDLQIQIYYLVKIETECGGIISVEKTKILAHRGNRRLNKNRSVGYVSRFQYLGCDVTYKCDTAFVNKINNRQALCGVRAKPFKNKDRLKTFYIIL